MIESKVSQPDGPLFFGVLVTRIDLLLILGAAALLPLNFVEAMNLWNRPQYQFFPLSVLAFGYLVISRGKIEWTKSDGRCFIGFAVSLSALILFAIATLRFSPWIAHVAIVLLTFGWMLLRLGGNKWHTVLCWIFVFAVTIPLPLNLDSKLVQTLQIISASSASKLMDLVGIPHLQKGTVIVLEQKELFVDQACSGIDSLYALIAVTAILVAVQRTSFLVSITTILFIPAWAWAGNLNRLFLIGLAMQYWGVDLSGGWQHMVLGLLIFLFTFLGAISTMVALAAFLKPLKFGKQLPNKVYDVITSWPGQSSLSSQGKKVAENSLQYQLGKALAFEWSTFKWSASIACVLFVFLGIVSTGKTLGVGPWRRAAFVNRIDKGSVEASLEQATLPKQIGAIEVDGFEITHREHNALMGEYSAIWHAMDNDIRLHISLDFPFADGHYLEQCFVLVGHSISQLEDYEYLSQFGPEYIREAILLDKLDQSTYISYCIFLANGKSLRETNPLVERLFPTQLDGLVYQLQIHVDNPNELSDEKKEEYRKILLELKKLLLPVIHKFENG